MEKQQEIMNDTNLEMKLSCQRMRIKQEATNNVKTQIYVKISVTSYAILKIKRKCIGQRGGQKIRDSAKRTDLQENADQSKSENDQSGSETQYLYRRNYRTDAGQNTEKTGKIARYMELDGIEGNKAGIEMRKHSVQVIPRKT